MKFLLVFCLIGFAANAQKRYDILITEFMADPSPTVGLPNAEWIEIMNVSSAPVNLQSWRIADETGQSGSFPAVVLQPDSVIIISSASSASQLAVLGRVVSVSSFPSLDNDGETISLRSPDGRVIHAVQYNMDSYHHDLKKEGGWSLEVMDITQPCIGKNNLTSSLHPSGGTPGQSNSLHENVEEEVTLLRTISPDSLSIVAIFNHAPDSADATIASNYAITNKIVTEAIGIPPLFFQYKIVLDRSLIPNETLQLTVKNIRACNNESIIAEVKVGLPGRADSLDLVINEILADGTDFVEIYNRSDKIIDIGNILIAKRGPNNSLTDFRKAYASSFNIYPGDYFTLTSDRAATLRQFFVKQPELLFDCDLPSLPIESGNVVLLNSLGKIIDEVHYDKEWHFALLTSTNNISLERINANHSSNKKQNWHSASSTSGYGTPTMKNSQEFSLENVDELIVSPLFAPNLDGIEDFALIQYKLNEPGFVANVFIYDASGRLVRHLVKNDMAGLSGTWKWDGLSEDGNALTAGAYIVFAEFFSMSGKKKTFKRTTALFK